MKRIIQPAVFLVLLFVWVLPVCVEAQCPAGYTRDTLNWDYLDFLPNTGSYVTSGYITLAQSQTQRFAFGTSQGTQSITITHDYSGTSDPGDNTTNTAEAGSYGTGADVQFKGDGTVTFQFQVAVRNIKFSVYDIDRNQKVTVTAFNGVTPIVITSLVKLSGSVLTIAGSGTNTASATASTTNVGNSSTDGTINVDIAGPVTKFVLTITNTSTNTGEDGSFWISEVSACHNGTFTPNYYYPSKPFTGQPAYVLTCRNDSVYYTDVASGRSKFLFADYGHNRMNSIAYDPNRHMVYYAYSLSGPGGASSSTDYILRRYDYDMDTLGVACPDIRALGIPVYDQSIESGAGAFYDGAVYLGIEGGSSVSDRESTIWRISLNGSYTPQPNAVQVFSVPSNTHDWSDIGIVDGILYDFDGSSSEDFYHVNLVTGNVLNYIPSPSSLVPRQTGVDWAGNVYNIGSPSTIAAGTIVPYNKNGTVNNAQLYNITFNGVAEVGSWGDAGEAFKPKTDFGDAPASYDPGTGDPGTHEVSDDLRLGVSTGIEWTKKAPFDGTGDGAEEDGLSGPQVISTGISNYLLKVSVFNNTGADATLIGWIDKNLNGKFESTEAVSANVPTSGAQQTINLLWNNINMPYAAGTVTYLRLRLTSASNGMTTSNPTGFYENGEIEDYKVTVSVVLPNEGIELVAQKINNTSVNLLWKTVPEDDIRSYELQRSKNASSWQSICERSAFGYAQPATYTYSDNNPDMPVSYFRVKATKASGELRYSETRKIDFSQSNHVSVAPNPAQDVAVASIQAGTAGTAQLILLDFTGHMVFNQTLKLTKGMNEVNLPVIRKLSSGIYKIKVIMNNEALVTSLVVIK